MSNIFDTMHSETAGSFIRSGSYPLEADYIFPTKSDLISHYSDSIERTLLHKGWLKIVEFDDTGNLALYWVIERDGELVFEKLIKDLDINNLLDQLDTLFQKVHDIIGTDDYSEIPEELNSLKDLAEAIIELRENVNTLKTELKVTVGTEEDDIVEYLKTLDYLNLTEVSEILHKFFDTIDESDVSINTLPELKEFLRGFEYTHNLYECFVDFWNNILGTPTPNTQFRTLRGILDFVEALASISKNTDENIQLELNLTLIGVGLDSSGLYSPDKETYYLKDATSVMNALKTLDGLVHTALSAFVINIANKDIVPLEVTKVDSGYIIGASLNISNSENNQLIKKTDGLYHGALLEYDSGTITFKVNDNIINQFNIGISAILKLGYYNSSNEEIVLEFNTLDGKGQIIKIPVGTLIREWIVDNNAPGKVVELTKLDIIDGPDKLSADVRISEKAHNILEKDGNTLYVEGTSDAITYNSLTLTSVILDIINKATTISNKLDSEILDRKDKDNSISDNITGINSKIDTNAANIAALELKINSYEDDYKLYTDTEILKELTRAVLAETNLLDKINTILINKLDTPDSGFRETYYLSIDGNLIGTKINIPEDKVVKSVIVKEVSSINDPYENAQVGDKYVEFTFEGTTTLLYLPVNDLVIKYKLGNGIVIEDNNTISAKVFINDKYLENGTDGIKTKGIDDAISIVKTELLLQINDKAPINSPIFTGVPLIEESPDLNDSSQKIPSTSWVNARVAEFAKVDPVSYWLKLTAE